MPETWLSTGEFAAVANLTRQAAHKALKRAIAGKKWNGQTLKVRTSHGSGGRSGIKYEVALSRVLEPSLSVISAAQSNQLVPLRERRIPACDQGQRIAERWSIIEHAQAFAPRSQERAAAINLASARSGHSVRTLQRWVRELEICGGDVNALARRKPAGAADRRVWVSRRFDRAFRAAQYDDHELQGLSNCIDQFSRSVWASPRQRSGWRMVCRDIVTLLKRECRDKGYILSDGAYYLSRRRIMGAEHFRRVDIFANDRKRFDDQKPRIRRDNSKLAPMAQIVMDVKPIDIVMMRDDGSTVWPKMIAFMDAGTHRTFPYFVLLAKGEGVRQEHVTAAFMEMVAHPDWGFPQQIYRDNGTEFYHFDSIRAGLELVQVPGRPTIINAKPYSGASKPIESKFAMLDRYVFNQFPGWAGGDRLNKKTQTVGKPPLPYAGTFDDFVNEAQSRIADFESIALLTGPFKGRSPADIYADHVADGWRPITVHGASLDAAFCQRLSRKVDRGAIAIDGTRYRHPELSQVNGRKVSIAISWRRGAWPLVELPDVGWVYLEPEMLHLPGDISGAIESSRHQRNEVRAIGALKKLAGSPPAVDVLADRVAILPTRASPAPLIDILLSSEATTIAEARADSTQRLLSAPSLAERQRARRIAETEELEAHIASKRA